jgi:hypothetical protein
VTITTVRLRVRRWRVVAKWRMRHAIPSVLGAAVLLMLGIGAAAVWGGDSGGTRAAPQRTAITQRAPQRVAQQADAAGAAERQQAVRWTTAHVGRHVVVACDPVLCGALTKAGRPQSSTVTIRATEGDLLQADVALVTSVIRGRYGANLDAITAPGVLAGIGQGDGRIEVRVVAPDGAADRRRRLVADTAERRVRGRELVGSGKLRLTGQARSQLAAGLVDTRLMSTLASVSTDHRLGVRAFADAGNPSTVAPYRTVLIYSVDGAAPSAANPRTAAVLRFLRAQDPPYQPLAAEVIRSPDLMRPVVRIRYSAPSPLGLLALPSGTTNH